MSLIEDVRPIDVQRTARPPIRAIALVVLSRAMVVVIVIVLAWAVSVIRPLSAGDRMQERPLTLVARSAVDPVGSSIAAMLDDVRSRAGREGGSIVDLELTRRDRTVAPVRLTVDLPGTDAAAVDRLVASLASSELIDPRPRSVDPTPAGLRITMDAALELMAAPPDGRAPDARAAAVALAEVAERAGVELRGASIPERPQDPVRLLTSGELAAHVRLISSIEQEHSAPLRFREVFLRRTSSDGYEAILSFVLREDVHRSSAEVRP